MFYALCTGAATPRLSFPVILCRASCLFAACCFEILGEIVWGLRRLGAGGPRVSGGGWPGHRADRCHGGSRAGLVFDKSFGLGRGRSDPLMQSEPGALCLLPLSLRGAGPQCKKSDGGRRGQRGGSTVSALGPKLLCDFGKIA